MSTDDKMDVDATASLTDIDTPNITKFLNATSSSKDEAVVVGLYGIPGSGKTHLLKQLERELDGAEFTFFEGSDVIDNVVPGGLGAFHAMNEDEKTQWRQLAIEEIGRICSKSKRAGVVTGHFMFWKDHDERGVPVYTTSDWKVYTYILYLNVQEDVIEQQRMEDTERRREVVAASHLYKWQQAEISELRDICRNHGILFSTLTPSSELLKTVVKLLHDFKIHSKEYNLEKALSSIDDVIYAGGKKVKTMLVLDADKTLSAQDAGMMFWENLMKTSFASGEGSPLKDLFSSPLGYSYTAFRQAVLLYEESANDEEFEALCVDVAAKVVMYPEFISLLHLVTDYNEASATIVTSGIRRVWERVLEREGLSEKVKVIGGGRITDNFVVNEEIKTALVSHLQERHDMVVWAFGDSPLDLRMLCKANKAVVVVGNEKTRSKNMDAALLYTIDHDGLRAHQTLLPSSVTPRLDVEKLPLMKLTHPDFISSLYGHYTHGGLDVTCAGDKLAAKLLATRMRDNAVAGPSLREAHRQIGQYLAIESVADVLGLEECPIQHVLGHVTSGFQLSHEKQTTVVALMRGGEPMALGVNDAFPLAMFVHANDPGDIKLHHLEGQTALILVDSVINTGKTIIHFVKHIRQIHATIRIVIVAGVVQAECVSGDTRGIRGTLCQGLSQYAKLHLVALRLSDTKFTGSGTTDTGNRLFNTTHLP